jgi:hypothetical protein
MVGAPGSGSTWELNAFDLPSGLKVYWIQTNFGDEAEDDKRRIIGTSEATDEEFVQLFFASNGKAFNVDGCCGSPPMEISTNLPRGEFLTNLFLTAFTAANSLRWVEGSGRLDLEDPLQRRELVENYLRQVVI